MDEELRINIKDENSVMAEETVKSFSHALMCSRQYQSWGPCGRRKVCYLRKETLHHDHTLSSERQKPWRKNGMV